MQRHNGITFPCKLFGLCDQEYHHHLGQCGTCRVVDIFIELNKLESGKGIRAIRTKLKDFPCALGGRRNCTPIEGHEHICDSCKVREVYLEYIEIWAKEGDEGNAGT